MNTFFGNLLAACVAFAVVLWFQWQAVEGKIQGMADTYGAPAEVQRMAAAPGAPENAAQTPVPAQANP